MAGDVRRIQEQLDEARLAFEEVDAAVDRKDFAQATAWCIDLVRRLSGVEQDVIDAGRRVQVAKLRRTHPR